MRRTAHPAAWIPPFAVGLAAAVAGELSVGLLLYSTPGFLRALTLILSVLLGSLALGLWTLPSRRRSRVEGLRRRWLLAVLAFAAAAAVSGMWTARGGLAATGLDRGLGLAFLAGLPLYACGALLVAMAESGEGVGFGAKVAAPAMAGATLGALMTGLVLLPRLFPVSIYSVCLAVISGGALLHGKVLAVHSQCRVLATLPSRYGEVRVEERSWGRPRRWERVLLENGRVRGREDEGKRPLRVWERASLAWLHSRNPRLEEGSEPPAVLFLGGGSLTVPRLFLDSEATARARVVEANPVIIEAARLHFHAPLDEPRLELEVGPPLRTLARGGSPLGAVLADAVALAPHEPVPQLEEALLLTLRRRMTDGGVLVVGGIDQEAAQGAPLEGLVEEAGRAFPYVAVYAHPSEEDDGKGELVVVLATEANEARWAVGGWTTLLEQAPPLPAAP